MSDLRTTASPAARTEIPRPQRGEGQWADGYTEPLSKNEQSKKDDDKTECGSTEEERRDNHGCSSTGGPGSRKP